jgi:hypothetical protein
MAFDLDAAGAETEPVEPFEFTFGGEGYVLPAEPDIRVFALLDGEHLERALALLLGDEQWERMLASTSTFRGRQMSALFEAYGKHAGFDAGKSEAN